MRKIKFLLAAALSMIAWTGAMAQTQHNEANYEAAKAAITDGGTYRIKTTVSGIDYYVTTAGALTSSKDDAGYFTITKTSGGNYGTGFRIDTGSERFTNPPLSNGVANLKPGSYAHSTNDRADWERQILYLNGDGKYAIRSCNCADGSSWNDAARTHWTYYINGDVVTPCYSYEAAYIWDFEVPPTIVNVTYKLVESDGTEVSSTTVKQEANSAVNVPKSFTATLYNSFWHEIFYFDYAVSGEIGDTDCTITVTRTVKDGTVHALTDLSNNKAYNIGCKRGSLFAEGDALVSTDLNAAASVHPLGKFAIISYEDNYYLYSVDESKFVSHKLKDGSTDSWTGVLTAWPDHGKEDALKLEAGTDPYFKFYFTFEGGNKGLNTNTTAPSGYVINSWNSADDGNLYFMVAVADFDPTEALAALDAYFHPSYFVTYVVKDEAGNTLYTSEPQPAKEGATITTLPADFQRPFYSYNDVDVTISQQETTVEFTATWAGPFRLSEDFASAQWQNMLVRGEWYVTSDNKNDEGALKTIQANAIGLVKEAYQWAFVGNGYEGFKIFNKAVGSDKVYVWKDDTNAIPEFIEATTTNRWSIVKITSTEEKYQNSFMLTIPGTTHRQLNQNGGAGGPLKLWTAGTTSDAGSAFTVFDIPTNFAEFTGDIEAVLTDAKTGYFTYNAATKALWKEEYKTNCDYDTYVTLKEAVDDQDNLIWPKTGYYRIKSANYDGRYMSYAEKDGEPQIATVVNPEEASTNVVKLTALDDYKYIVTVGGLSVTGVSQSQNVVLGKEGVELQAVATGVGKGTFTTGETYGALHCASSSTPAYYLVGWTSDAAASQWIIEDATVESIEATIGETGYATLNAIWPVAVPSGVKAYTGKINDETKRLTLTEVEGTIPAATPVVLKGEAGTYTFNFADDTAALEDNVLKGTYTETEAAGKYVLAQPEGEEIGFYLAKSGTIAAGKAYLEVPEADEVKGFTFFFDDATGIANIETAAENGAIYNLAGQRVNKAQKGIYIINGKKILK